MDSYQQTPDLPLVSVIIPAYNAEDFIERTLKSVLSQTYKKIEVLVVDDGSQDQTPEIVKSIACQDPRVILLRQPNSGTAAARNLAIQKSKGEFIAPIDADDIWYHQNIEKQVQCLLKADPSVGVVYAWSVDIDREDKLTGGFRASKIQGEVYTTLVSHYFLGNGSASLVRRTCFEKVGGYNTKELKEPNAHGCEDWELYLRIAEHYQFRVVPQFLIGYRKIPSSMSGDYTSMAKFHHLLMELIKQRHPQIPNTICRLSRSSFYIYLARQSSQNGSHRSTLFWLYKTFQSDFITPFLCLDLYPLSFKTLLKLMIRPITSLVCQDNFTWLHFKRCFDSNHRVTTPSHLNKQRKNINLKLFAENILHQMAPIIFGTPKTWQKIYKNKQLSSISHSPFSPKVIRKLKHFKIKSLQGFKK